jgi:hypothetical protein
MLSLSACGDDPPKKSNETVYTVADIYGTWKTDVMHWGPYELRGVKATFTESHFLVEVDRVHDRETLEERTDNFVNCFAPDITIDPDGSGKIANLVSLREPDDNWYEWTFEVTSRDAIILRMDYSFFGEDAADLEDDEATLTRASQTRTIDTAADCTEM